MLPKSESNDSSKQKQTALEDSKAEGDVPSNELLKNSLTTGIRGFLIRLFNDSSIFTLSIYF